ncbi:hypothetical protein TOT_020000990 [Theileria orientalis strain Shintoku]|uniref:Uncharacterized protein n=1 Tax=Theileria orientalis strain Shintoku TaxID=869250 RepID=J4D8E3_THEOR|nr:hypothetical protein TOT_020000990 [Theileria orientalis strain Shintoku]BAM40735.1 hypothetical protein TOT_020000990 [Theileria orientalis strain Shintoku]|eukprot:XP_009691036.1 hypothetical protein TOT_020000990 [Theileria orientalis strain Shintoku]
MVNTDKNGFNKALDLNDNLCQISNFSVGPRLLDEVGHKSETGSTDTNHDKKSRLESAGGLCNKTYDTNANLSFTLATGERSRSEFSSLFGGRAKRPNMLNHQLLHNTHVITHKASIHNRPVTPTNRIGYTSTRRQHINHVTHINGCRYSYIKSQSLPSPTINTYVHNTSIT